MDVGNTTMKDMMDARLNSDLLITQDIDPFDLYPEAADSFAINSTPGDGKDDDDDDDIRAFEFMPEDEVPFAEMESEHSEMPIVQSEDNSSVSFEDDSPKLISSSIESGDVVIDLPLENLNELFKTVGTVQLLVHKINLTVSTESLEAIGIRPNDEAAMRAVVGALEERLTPEEALEIRSKQTLSLSRGSHFSIKEGEPVLDTSNFKLLIPELVTRVRIEQVGREIEDHELSHMNLVAPSFQHEARGLQRVLKNGAAAQVLNAVQEQGGNEELSFYFDILKRLDLDSPTRAFALLQLRTTMNYGLNVDNLQMKSVLTEVLM